MPRSQRQAARVEVLCVGTELLSGKINTHTSLLSRALAGIGLAISRETAVGDSEAEIRDAARGALERSRVVLICGGLGPTFDDVTREGAAAALGARLVYRPGLYAAIRRRFLKSYRRIPRENRRQAFALQGASILPNRRGSAPGQILETGGKTVVLLPGPPSELEPMLKDALPVLEKTYAPHAFTVKTVYHLCGISESAADEALSPLSAKPRPGLAFTILARQGLVDFHVTARASSRRAAERLARQIRSRVERLARDRLFGVGDETLEGVVGGLLRRRGLSLAAAESCTAGLLSGRLTEVPGSSDYFLGSVIAYADAVKRNELGVSAKTLKAHGAVSGPCAREMAEGAMERMRAGCALSITGIAGPGGGTVRKPVGLAYIGLARRGRPTLVRRFKFPGSRAQVRECAVIAALSLLLSSLRD